VIREEKVDRWNSVILLRILVDSDNGIVNSQVTKNLMLVTMLGFHYLSKSAPCLADPSTNYAWGHYSKPDGVEIEQFI